MPVHNGYNVGAFVMNVLTSVLLILANKVVMSSEGYGFFFAVTLSSLHFIVAGMAMQLYSTMGFVKSGPSVPLKDKVIFVATADFSIIFLNSSLLLNTVGFYQISKLLVIPFVCLVDRFWLGKEFTGQRVFSIVVTVVGVAIVTVSDFSVNTFGMIIAMCSVVAAGMQQILCGEIQRRNRVSSVEMLLATAWPQGLSLMVVGPWLDRGFSGHWVQEYVLTAGATAMIGVTCLLAVGVNISQFITLGRFSATAYQVMGHSKTVLVLICGFLFFEESINPRQAGGMLLAVVGMVLYGAFSVRERKSETQPLALAPSSSSEEPAPVSPLLQVIQDASRRHPQTLV